MVWKDQDNTQKHVQGCVYPFIFFYEKARKCPVSHIVLAGVWKEANRKTVARASQLKHFLELSSQDGSLSQLYLFSMSHVYLSLSPPTYLPLLLTLPVLHNLSLTFMSIYFVQVILKNKSVRNYNEQVYKNFNKGEYC